MSYREPSWLKLRGPLVMEVAVALADYTQKLSLCEHIPAYLSQTLDSGPMTLALIREVPGAQPEIVLCASSGDPATSPPNTSRFQDILKVYDQTRPLTAQDAPALRAGFELRHVGAPDNVSEMAVQHLADYTRAIVFTRAVDEYHRLLLVVHQRTEDPQLATELAEMLQLIASQLAKLLGCLVAWTSGPAKVGEPFDRLTQREWMVLRGLSSEAGEKQLADELGLSPHTLHSHIKSIYRKVGVQGRLPLLLRAESALRGLRVQGAKNGALSRIASEPANVEPCAIAAG
jgi:DNA-binding CsgD family transcriptional regulator